MEEIKNISQGGGFIVKETAANTVFTPEDFSEEQLMMKESVRVCRSRYRSKQRAVRTKRL